MKCPKCKSDNPDTKSFCGECGTRIEISDETKVSGTTTLETPSEEITIGSTFASRYQVIDELGKGGMGKVYRVLDKKLNEEVALKLMKHEISLDKKTVERFTNELKLARKIVHKNIARMFDLNEEKGTHYITMEYVKGEDLKRLIRKIGLLGAGQAIPIAKQICEGLEEAHRSGVVHRDLKPQNVMVDEDGNARIMDFGISRSLESKGITDAGMMIGTPEYMSPEQVEAKDIDLRSDIYSLGIILYEMTTGQLPFAADTPFAVGIKQKSEKPKNPRNINPQIPEDLSRVILKCLNKVKDARYQSAGEVRSELVDIERALPTTERKVPLRKPLTSREITVHFSMKKIFVPALIFAAVVIIGVIIWQALPRKSAAPFPSDKPSLAVMYFENNTGDVGLEHYRKALSDLLIADLSQSKYIRVLRGDSLYNILNRLDQLESKSYSSDVLKEVAERGRVNHILQGNFTKAGDNFRINIMLHDAFTEELIGSEGVEGIGEDSIFSMVDELTRRIKGDFEFSKAEIARDIDSEVATITTHSAEAYKLYSEGRGYHLQSDYWKSIGTLQKALKIDPEFAMAWRSVAMSFNNMGIMPGKRNALQKAFELSDRVSERERYIIHADYYQLSEKTLGEAQEAFNKLLELYPDDYIGNNNLGLLYIELEEFDKAVERFTRNLQNDTENRLARWNLAETYAAMGLYDKALEVLKSYAAEHPDEVGFHSKMAKVYLFQGKYTKALEKLNKVLALEPESRLEYEFRKGDIYLLQGDYVKAGEQYKKVPEVNQGRRRRLASLNLYQGKFNAAKTQLLKNPVLHETLAYLYFRSGNPEEALKKFNDILKEERIQESLTGQAIILSAMGVVHLQMKHIVKAEKTADEILALVQAGVKKKTIRYYHLLMGKIELEKGESSRAITFLNQAVDSLYAPNENHPNIHSFFINSLAQAHFNAGNLNEAQENFERIHSLASGRLEDGDFYAKSFYMLGKICEQRGDTAKAVEHYEKFLDLWKDADPGLAEVEDAKRRLAELK